MSITLINPFWAGGVAAPPQPGTIPTDFASCKFWIDGTDAGFLYTDTASGGGVQVTSDGQGVGFAVSKASYASCGMATIAANKPLYKTGIVNGNSVLRFDGSNDAFAVNNRSGLNQGGGTFTLNDLLGNGDYSYVAVLSVLSATLTDTDTYDNHRVFGDNGTFQGLYIQHVDASDCLAHGYHWDGAEKNATKTIGKNTFVCLGVTHTGGNIKIRTNGGSWTTTAAGNITTTSNSWSISRTATNPCNMDLVHLCVFDTALADADLLSVEQYLAYAAGITVP